MASDFECITCKTPKACGVWGECLIRHYPKPLQPDKAPAIDTSVWYEVHVNGRLWAQLLDEATARARAEIDEAYGVVQVLRVEDITALAEGAAQ